MFVIATLSNVSEVDDSAAMTDTLSVIVATPLAIIIVEEFAVAGVHPIIPSGSGFSFHSVVPTGLDPSSGYVLASTGVACL